MIYTAVFSRQALRQLEELEEYIAARSSPAMAERYIDAVISTCSSLARFPERGTLHSDLRPGLRITHHRSRTAIVFVVRTTTVRILGIYYGGQNYKERQL